LFLLHTKDQGQYITGNRKTQGKFDFKVDVLFALKI
jgi:hypothetical protein